METTSPHKQNADWDEHVKQKIKQTGIIDLKQNICICRTHLITTLCYLVGKRFNINMEKADIVIDECFENCRNKHA